MEHEIRFKSEHTGSSSHYDIRFYTTFLVCSCGAKIGVHSRDTDEVILEHKIDVILKALDIRFRIRET